jgi:hypothetical protein
MVCASSVFSTAHPPLLSFSEGPGVDHVDGPVFVQDEHDLKKSTAFPSPPDKPFIVLNPPWEWPSRP